MALPDRDEIRPDTGRGRLSPKAERELRELDDPTHPRTCLSPDCECEIVNERVALAGDDEKAVAWDPDTHPKSFNGAADLSDPVADDCGRLIDVQRDSPLVDDLADFDLTADDLFEVDL